MCVLQNSKFTYLSNYLKYLTSFRRVLQNSKFTYLSNEELESYAITKVLQNSKFTYLSNNVILRTNFCMFCRIQNLHISQTIPIKSLLSFSFVEFKIYISLKLIKQVIELFCKFCRIQNLHISQTLIYLFNVTTMFCRIQNLHISQTHKFELVIHFRFVEFKIYISLKQEMVATPEFKGFVEFKIYISLKPE